MASYERAKQFRLSKEMAKLPSGGRVLQKHTCNCLIKRSTGREDLNPLRDWKFLDKKGVADVSVAANVKAIRLLVGGDVAGTFSQSLAC